MYQAYAQNQHCDNRIPPLLCYDNEDIEPWLVDEGIGYYDECEVFHYGPNPREWDEFDYDVPTTLDDLLGGS